MQNITILGVRNHAGPGGEDVTDSQTDSLYLPANPETFTHDPDGNLTSDGQWTYIWNAENQLTAMETRPDLPATLPRQRLEFTYDHQGRRIRKQTFDWDTTGETFTPASDTWFIYHGWKLLAEGVIQNSEFMIQTSHLWGHDVTGTFEGAGTVGGLLATTQHPNPSISNTYFLAYDGNGNVAAAVNAATGDTEARFHYGPFGETLTSTGPAAEKITHRFSTKYTDLETGLLYYGYRYLNPDTGRWLNRDPIAEAGGLNLYGFVGNSAISKWDYLGLSARSYARDKLSEAQRVAFGAFEGYDSGMWISIINTLIPALRNTYRVYYGDGPKYHPLTGISISRNESTHNVIHEVIHSINSPSVFNMMNERKDEGIAHAYEYQYRVIEELNTLYKDLESGLPAEKIRPLTRAWARGWGHVSVGVSGQTNSGAFTLSGTDFDNVERYFSVKLSCERAAKKLNDLSAGAARCGIKFLCEAGRSGWNDDNTVYEVRYRLEIHETLK